MTSAVHCPHASYRIPRRKLRVGLVHSVECGPTGIDLMRRVFVSGNKRIYTYSTYILVQSLLVTFGQVLLQRTVGDHVREAVGEGGVREPMVLLFQLEVHVKGKVQSIYPTERRMVSRTRSMH